MKNVLSSDKIEAFIHQGFVKLEKAFPRKIADDVRTILWRETGCNPDDPATWTKPVVWLGNYNQPPFREAANTPELHRAFDQLVGPGRWIPRTGLGSFPIRFPSSEESGDSGWHVDAGFPGDQPDDYLQWRINVYSKGRALLMLFLFSDIGRMDAPTRIRVGSHLEVSAILKPAGEAGMTAIELATKLAATAHLTEVAATGEAGTAYLCHPFLVHAAQANRCGSPRFLAQPPLLLKDRLDLQGSSPVEVAIRIGLNGRKNR